MRAYVGYSTSLLYWLQHGTDVPCYSRVANIKSLTNATYSLQDLQELDLESLGLTTSEPHGWPSRRQTAQKSLRAGSVFHVLVPKGVDHNPLEGFERHCWASHIPDGSFCRLRRDVWVSTPAFSFMQLAGILTIPQLALVGNWLCGRYRLRGDGTTLPVDPITTKDELLEYLSRAEGCYGAKKARRSLAWVAEGARSPMEASLAALIALPVRFGGYGFRLPHINYSIDASDYDPLTLDREDREHFEIDLYWPHKRVGIEYDGAIHYEHEQMRTDKRRLNCLLTNGERILVVMYDQIIESDIRKTLMNQLAILLEARRRKLSKEEQAIQDGLLSMFFERGFSL